MNPISLIVSLFGLFNKTDTGAKIGAGTSYVAIGAALAPVALLAAKNWNDVFMTLTVGEGVIIGSLVASIILIALKTRTAP